MTSDHLTPTVTVIIPAYTMKRWGLLSESVASVEAQTQPPTELILCIDHNDELYDQAIREWETRYSSGGFPIHVIANKYEQDPAGSNAHAKAHGAKRRFGAGWARNSAAEVARGDVLAFLDDDAAADPDWLKFLLAPYEDPTAVAVGGAPLPAFETSRPAWFPPNFDWVFGCAYEGLPRELSPLGHLIGANMSVRRSVFETIGGFHSIDFDDLDLCMRVAAAFPQGVVLYEPNAIVHHYVPAERVSWRYFWRRCFFVNREKVDAFTDMGSAANIRAERAFVRRAVTTQVRREVGHALQGQPIGLVRLGAMFVGIFMAAAGNLVGRIQLWRR
jgi:glycosyltransferase involved in cell wall biosynthesis